MGSPLRGQGNGVGEALLFNVGTGPNRLTFAPPRRCAVPKYSPAHRHLARGIHPALGARERRITQSRRSPRAPRQSLLHRRALAADPAAQHAHPGGQPAQVQGGFGARGGRVAAHCTARGVGQGQRRFGDPGPQAQPMVRSRLQIFHAIMPPIISAKQVFIRMFFQRLFRHSPWPGAKHMNPATPYKPSFRNRLRRWVLTVCFERGSRAAATRAPGRRAPPAHASGPGGRSRAAGGGGGG